MVLRSLPTPVRSLQGLFTPLFLALCFYALPGFALDPAAAKQRYLDLYDLEIAIHKTNTAFHMFTVQDGSPNYEARLEKAIALADERFGPATEDTGDATVDEQLAIIRNRWKDYIDTAKSNGIATDGYTDTYVSLDLQSFSHEIFKAIAAAQSALAPTAGISDELQNLLKTARDVQYVTARYARRAASFGGQVIASEDLSDIENIEDIVSRISASMDEMKSRYAQNEATADAFRRINSKWRFIEKSLMNYNENTVPFVVDRYAEQMVADLEEIARIISS